ncbi:MAG: coenzyme F430 synthase [Methanosphaera stadtmanae]|nr:coenzyme F430 synthase [Methanosphaera stadtmanae]
MTKNIIISDANHGGLTLLHEYSKYTNNNLFFYDVYNKLTNEEKKDINKKYNVTFLSLDYIKENRDKFTIISPIHMKPVFESDYTHHEFTSYLINKHRTRYNWNFKIIEVTGVKGKTTTVSMIKDVLKNKNLLVLNSNNLSYISNGKTKTLIKHLSITPASIITALNKANNEKILDKIDYCIFEVSLGVTPNADIGILTNILENYSIADKTKNAHIAKKTVFQSKKIICDKIAYDTYYSDVKKDIITISLNDQKADVYLEKIQYNLEKTRFTVNYYGNKLNFSCFGLSDFYINNLMFAITVGLLINDSNETSHNLKNIKPINGRGSYKYKSNKLIIEDINPGLNTTAIKECISNIKRYSNNYILIIGGDYGITCEEIDEKILIEFIKTLNEDIIFSGAVGHNLYKQVDNKNYEYIHDINKALNYCLNKNVEIIEILYRSEYNQEINLYNK